eukprot:TRINITY_DN8817_c0_g1_i1.p1 TRINITY_DN8817_c0_g1~~TRINITY_DN8817_c0_g1_i1.p1  ORF type:complete len:259 (+),score=16.47 TRINITY_DN8817_c0_g1_i1:24-800(+)
MEGSEDRNDPEAKEMITFEDIPSDDPKQNTKDRTHPLNDDQCKKINTYIDYRGLSDDDPQVRINKLNEIDDPKYDEEVIFLLLNDEDEEVRKTASKKLVVGASEERVYLLFKVAHESELVVDTLEEILDVEGQGRTVINGFKRALKHHDPQVRTNAITVANKLVLPNANEDILAAFEGETNVKVKIKAGLVLAKIKNYSVDKKMKQLDEFVVSELLNFTENRSPAEITEILRLNWITHSSIPHSRKKTSGINKPFHFF